MITAAPLFRREEYGSARYTAQTRAGHPSGVATGAGWGTDAIILEWGGQRAVVRGLDLLRAWVETFAPEDAARFPKGGDR